VNAVVERRAGDGIVAAVAADPERLVRIAADGDAAEVDRVGVVAAEDAGARARAVQADLSTPS
jgi:hypothetical protein